MTETGDAAPTPDVTPAHLSDLDDQPLVSSRSRTSPQDWDGGERFRALQRCHHLAAAHAVGSPLSGIRSTPAGPGAGPAHPSEPDLTQSHVRSEP
jgi:hypothetical protein